MIYCKSQSTFGGADSMQLAVSPATYYTSHCQKQIFYSTPAINCLCLTTKGETI